MDLKGITRKGIILAGGSGSRLYPITNGISKQLLPIYNKPMIYYPMSVLMLAGIQDILVISTPADIQNYRRLFDDGSNFGINIKYKVQETPAGLAQAFILGETFIGNSNVAMVLGDNIFYGKNFNQILEKSHKRKSGATIFGYKVNDPNRFGVIEFDDSKRVISIDEKPIEPKSNFAVTGLYFYDNDVIEIAKSIQPSTRGELEITDINNEYLRRGKLKVELLDKNFKWLDTGTFDSLLEATFFVKNSEEKNKIMIACLEEIAFNNSWITKNELILRANLLKHNDYGKYLFQLIEVN